MRKGWERKPLGELCEVIAGQSPEGRFYNFEEMGIPFYQGKKEFGEKFIEVPTTWTTKTTKIAIAGDILMSVRAPVGPVNFSTEQICIGRGLAAIRSGNNLSRDFLFYQLLYLQPEIAGKEGAVFASINKSEIEALPLILPPLEEQQRIVSILDEAFAGLASAQANAARNLQNARALFESHLQAVFAQRGEGWVETTVGNVCTIKSGTTVSPTLEKPIGEIPYLKVADMTLAGNEIEITTSSRFLCRSEVRESTIIPKGSTIFPKRGGAILTNKKRITLLPICADLNIMAVTPSSVLDFKLLYYYFQHLDLKKLGSGSSIPQINNYDIVPLPLSFPTSISEQQLIVTQLDDLATETQHLTRIYEQKLAALAALKKSLLHQAFSGEL
jgi:type I restriction enzyme S subunit